MRKHTLNSRIAQGLLTVFLSLLPAAVAQSQTEFKHGLSEFRAGHYAAAAELFARAEAASPGSTEALLYRAKSLVHLQDFGSAETALNSYVAFHPQSSDALYLLGFVLNRQNRPSESLTIYTRAAAVTPPAGDDLKIVGLNYVLLNDYADAIKWLEKSVERDAKNADAWYYLGRAYYTKGRLGEARRAFLTVLDLDPENARAESNLGLVLELDGQPGAAVTAYRQAIAWQEQSLNPSEQPYVNLGNLLAAEGRVDEAIAPLEKAVALAPGNAFCRLGLGLSYLRSRRLEEAQRELEKATQLEPENPVAHYQLGRLYKEIHAFDRAKAEFERTAELQNRSSKPRSDGPQR